MSYYDDLGVTPDASPDEIKKAHRRAAKRHHPDNAETGDSEAFQRAQQAYVVLSDPDSRDRYDRGDTVGQEPDNRAARVADILIRAFMDVMQRADIEHDDLTAKTALRIGEMLHQTEAEIAHGEKVIGKLTTIRERLTARDGPDIIGHALDGQKRDAERGVAALRERMEWEAEALEKAATFDYRYDPRPEPEAPWTGNVRPAQGVFVQTWGDAQSQVREAMARADAIRRQLGQ